MFNPFKRSASSPTPDAPAPSKNLSRRSFLKVGATAAIGSALTHAKARDIALETFSREDILTRINTARRFLQNRYQIVVETGPLTERERQADDITRGEPLSIVEQCDALEQICEELEKYPLLLTIKLRRMTFHLLKNLRTDGHNIRGAAASVLYISPGKALVNGDSSGIFRRVFHHELFHMLDARMGDGSDWNNLRLAPDEPTPYSWQRVLPKEGYVVGYSRTNELEDRAMIGQFLMSYPDILYLNRRIQSDITLRAKVRVVKQQFFEGSFGAMNAQFWRDMANDDVGPDYWNHRDPKRPTPEFIAWARAKYPNEEIRPEDFHLDP